MPWGKGQWVGGVGGCVCVQCGGWGRRGCVCVQCSGRGGGCVQCGR